MNAFIKFYRRNSGQKYFDTSDVIHVTKITMLAPRRPYVFIRARSKGEAERPHSTGIFSDMANHLATGQQSINKEWS
jgi:hypothetical protein